MALAKEFSASLRVKPRAAFASFSLPTEVIAAETFRAQDGLALSSRNVYLSPSERSEAPMLFQTLQNLAKQIQSGHTDIQTLEDQAMKHLTQRGWEPDYVSVRKRSDLLTPSDNDLKDGTPLVVLSAAKLGTTRLIDNLEI